MAGRIELQWIVGTSGAVQAVSVNEGFDPALSSCAAAAVRRWTFPAPDGGIAAVTMGFRLDTHAR